MTAVIVRKPYGLEQKQNAEVRPKLDTLYNLETVSTIERCYVPELGDYCIVTFKDGNKTKWPIEVWTALCDKLIAQGMVL